MEIKIDITKVKKQQLIDILFKKIETTNTKNLQDLTLLAVFANSLIDETYKDVSCSIPYKNEDDINESDEFIILNKRFNEFSKEDKTRIINSLKEAFNRAFPESEE